MELIDTHCHLDGFYEALPDVLDRASKALVTRMIAGGTEPKDWAVHASLADRYAYIFYTVGIHPTNISSSWEKDLEEMENYFVRQKRPVAIGEIGLDYHNLQDDIDCIIRQQQIVFREQLRIAKKHLLPIVIHSRDAFTDFERIIEEEKFPWEQLVIHCFSEGPDVIQRINERGGRGSFTGIVTYKSAENVRQALQRQGIDRLMLETDCPFLAPTPYRSQRNEPAYLRRTAQFVAELVHISEAELSTITTHNAISFFHLT